MKKLSKIVALLLAGAMAMLMFTACSGGGGSADTQKEEAIRKQLGTKTEAVKLCDNDGKVKNDSKLYKETAELLDARIKAETSAFGILLVDFDVKGVNPAEQYVTVTLSADYKTAGLVAGLVNLITEKLGKIDATNSNVKLDTEWAKAAVVVRTNEKGQLCCNRNSGQEPQLPQDLIISTSFPGEQPPSGAFCALHPLSHALWSPLPVKRQCRKIHRSSGIANLE